MSVELDPTELGFRRPFNREVTEELHVKNPNSSPIAFKVKTTAPKQYCVRPNSGRIEAGQELSVQVLLQAMRDDPAPDYKCRDKFLVQSVLITADQEFSAVPNIWSHFEKNEKSKIQEKKIRVVFLPEESSGEISHARNPPTSPPPYEDDHTANQTAPVDLRLADKNTAREASVDAMGDINPPRASSSSELATARAEIDKLKSELKEQTLRLRKSKSASTDANENPGDRLRAPGMLQSTSQGVPVQIVAALCLAAFILAWLFF